MRISNVPRWFDDAADILEYMNRPLVRLTEQADESLR